ncbi:MAG: ImmA/IrrE family metallo-endopeptidase [Gemmatimonadaceae bacterium]
MTGADGRIEELARRFWAETRLATSFPRDIERAVALALPVAVIVVSRLTSEAIRAWLRRRRLGIPVPEGHDDLMGCIIARGGNAFILVSGSDPEEERRYTIAHEVAHLLLHYLLPREQVTAVLGEGIVDVLDGIRPPTLAERAAAIFSSIRLGAHVHLMPRHGRGASVVARLEDEADALALELVAPREAITLLSRSPELRELDDAERCRSLGVHFGVPPHLFEPIVRPNYQSRPVSFVDQLSSVLREQKR